MFPHANPTQFKVADLLQIAGVLSYDAVRTNGAILTAMIKWSCTLDSGCNRGIEVTRMDSYEQGFKTEKVTY